MSKMTREDRLYAMRMTELVEVAEAEGIKIDRKGSKAKAVEKILAAEVAHEEVVAEETEALVESFQNEVEEVAEAVTETVEAAEEPKAEEPKVKKTTANRKHTKKSFEELVADIPAIGNMRFIRSAKGAVHVKVGTNHKRLFGYTGSVLVVGNEALVKGLDYAKKSYGCVLAPTKENMMAILRNAG